MKKTSISLSKKQKNLETYLKEPEIEQIMAFINELGVSMTRFERFYGIPIGTIRQVKCGNTPLSPKYWHIIYEKVVPTYGVGYSKYFKEKNKKDKTKKTKGKYLPAQKTTIADNSLLNELKSKLGED